ncbi:MAG: thiamine phosphate synthase, partial [Planctomycetota bacterium]
TESRRQDLADVATAACKRLTEALRSIEEYCKFVVPDRVLAIERMRYDAYTLEQRLVSRLLVGERFAKVKLYVLISRKFVSGSVRELARQVIAGGADAVQLREKGLDDDVVLAEAAELRELTDETNRLLIINDRADIAAMVAADGVHLGQHDVPLAEARKLLRPGAIIGRSCHSLAQAKAAINEGADYISLGPIFQTSTKDAGPPVGPDLFKQALEEVKLPIVAVGGINAENVAKVVEAGAKSVAVSSAICTADDPKAAAKAIKKQLG